MEKKVSRDSGKSMEGLELGSDGRFEEEIVGEEGGDIEARSQSEIGEAGST